MTNEQTNQLLTFIFDKQTKELSVEFWQDLKTPFMSDPNLLIQLTEISSQNYQSESNVKKIITSKIEEDLNYAKRLENWLSKIESVNKIEEIKPETDQTSQENEESTK